MFASQQVRETRVINNRQKYSKETQNIAKEYYATLPDVKSFLTTPDRFSAIAI